MKAEDKWDILHTIIMTLAVAERNNGHKPDNPSWMYRIASYTVADYWRAYYKVNNGLDCHTCSKAQWHKCKEDDLYAECPKAIKLDNGEKLTPTDCQYLWGLRKREQKALIAM